MEPGRDRDFLKRHQTFWNRSLFRYYATITQPGPEAVFCSSIYKLFRGLKKGPSFRVIFHSVFRPFWRVSCECLGQKERVNQGDQRQGASESIGGDSRESSPSERRTNARIRVFFGLSWSFLSIFCFLCFLVSWVSSRIVSGVEDDVYLMVWTISLWIDDVMHLCIHYSREIP